MFWNSYLASLRLRCSDKAAVATVRRVRSFSILRRTSHDRGRHYHDVEQSLLSFSSNPIHALRNTSELMQLADDTSSTYFLLNRDSGWMVGPKHRLLFWVPLASRHPFYSPQTALVIPKGGPELDLSRMDNTGKVLRVTLVLTMIAAVDQSWRFQIQFY
ncbi:hypothetical protein P692DRAFT_20212367 [Suillus brevipes Sb2]|nr:hypothetical protein P692DRAFT_20212367 [Suillus brevipes Sb2]